MLDCLLWMEPEEFAAWRARLDLERRARHLTLHRQAALRALLGFWGPDGLWPSDATVAAQAGVSVSTVRRARRDARALGLLTWEPQRQLVAGRWVQGPNAYAVHVPTTPVCPGVQRGRARQQDKTEGLRGRSAQAQLALLGAVQRPEVARAALNAIAARRAALAAALWRGRHGAATA